MSLISENPERNFESEKKKQAEAPEPGAGAMTRVPWLEISDPKPARRENEATLFECGTRVWILQEIRGEQTLKRHAWVDDLATQIFGTKFRIV